MGIRETGVLRLDAKAYSLGDLVSAGEFGGWNESLRYYLDPDAIGLSGIGDILLVPTYRLEEVEEVIEPEKPGVPVEPYVGLSWEYEGRKHVVVEVAPNYIQVAAQGRSFAWGVGQFFAMGSWYTLLSDLLGYPRTPSTPAVTRKVKKWVKIDPSPDSPEC